MVDPGLTMVTAMDTLYDTAAPVDHAPMPLLLGVSLAIVVAQAAPLLLLHFGDVNIAHESDVVDHGGSRRFLTREPELYPFAQCELVESAETADEWLCTI